MDDGRGNMVPVSEGMLKEIEETYFEKHQKPMEIESMFRIFQEGEIFEIKGSHFKIETILANGLRLKLLPDGFVPNTGSVVTKGKPTGAPHEKT